MSNRFNKSLHNRSQSPPDSSAIYSTRTARDRRDPLPAPSTIVPSAANNFTSPYQAEPSQGPSAVTSEVRKELISLVTRKKLGDNLGIRVDDNPLWNQEEFATIKSDTIRGLFFTTSTSLREKMMAIEFVSGNVYKEKHIAQRWLTLRQKWGIPVDGTIKNPHEMSYIELKILRKSLYAAKNKNDFEAFAANIARDTPRVKYDPQRALNKIIKIPWSSQDLELAVSCLDWKLYGLSTRKYRDHYEDEESFSKKVLKCLDLPFGKVIQCCENGPHFRYEDEFDRWELERVIDRRIQIALLENPTDQYLRTAFGLSLESCDLLGISAAGHGVAPNLQDNAFRGSILPPRSVCFRASSTAPRANKHSQYFNQSLDNGSRQSFPDGPTSSSSVIWRGSLPVINQGFSDTSKAQSSAMNGSRQSFPNRPTSSSSVIWQGSLPVIDQGFSTAKAQSSAMTGILGWADDEIHTIIGLYCVTVASPEEKELAFREAHVTNRTKEDLQWLWDKLPHSGKWPYNTLPQDMHLPREWSYLEIKTLRAVSSEHITGVPYVTVLARYTERMTGRTVDPKRSRIFRPDEIALALEYQNWRPMNTLPNEYANKLPTSLPYAALQNPLIKLIEVLNTKGHEGNWHPVDRLSLEQAVDQHVLDSISTMPDLELHDKFGLDGSQFRIFGVYDQSPGLAPLEPVYP